MRTEYVLGGIVIIALGVGFVFLIGGSSTSGKPLTEGENVSQAVSLKSPVEKARLYPKAPELVSPDGYINTPSTSSGQAGPITIGEFLEKKVVLIDFWTYSCINCQRTLPYLKDWYQKYSDKGLEIIGVHTPEFAFEKLQSNVQKYVTENKITYPVILDNDYKTWNAFGNQYWPRKYLIDIDGYIVYDHIGEGAYEETESAIRRALEERAARLALDMPEVVESGTPVGVIAVEGGKVRSPETYFGSARNSNLGNGVSRKAGDQTLAIPSPPAGGLTPNEVYLSGTWNFQPEYAVNKTAGAKIQFFYNSKDVYFVASADPPAGGPVKIKVTRDDGQPLGEDRGADVDADGIATIQEDRLYKLIEGTDYGVHTLEIEIEGVGLKAYTFTFG